VAQARQFPKPAPDVMCAPCAKNGHRVQAVEYVPAFDADAPPEPQCVFCRDDDPCPGCETAQKMRAPLQTPKAAETPHPCNRGCGKPAHRGLCKGQTIEAAKLRAQHKQRVSFSQIKDEFARIAQDYGKFESHGDISVRYPTREEIRTRVRPGPKDDHLAQLVRLCEASETGCSEFRPFAGVRLQSFASRVGNQLRKRSAVKFSVYVDKRTNTVLVQRRMEKGRS
jgi:hypothetical protein